MSECTIPTLTPMDVVEAKSVLPPGYKPDLAKHHGESLEGKGNITDVFFRTPGKLMASPLGYWIREGKHSMNREDWGVFLDYADRNLKGK